MNNTLFICIYSVSFLSSWDSAIVLVLLDYIFACNLSMWFDFNKATEVYQQLNVFWGKKKRMVQKLQQLDGSKISNITQEKRNAVMPTSQEVIRWWKNAWVGHIYTLQKIFLVLRPMLSLAKHISNALKSHTNKYNKCHKKIVGPSQAEKPRSKEMHLEFKLLSGHKGSCLFVHRSIVLFEHL